MNNNKKKFFSFMAVLSIFACLLPMHILAADESGYRADSSYNKHTQDNQNIILARYDADGNVEEKSIAYCFNMNRNMPIEYEELEYRDKDNTYGTVESEEDATWRVYADNPNYDGDLKDILTKVVNVGYPYNNSGEDMETVIKEKCHVDDELIHDVFIAATQKAIWRITDGREFNVPADGVIPTGNTESMVSDYIGQLIYEKAIAMTEDVILPTRLYRSLDDSGNTQHLFDTAKKVKLPKAVEETLEIPFTKTIIVNGTVAPAKTTFEFEITPINQDVDTSGITVESTSITTEGAGDYKGTITFMGDLSLIEKAGGFRIKEKESELDNWTYDTTSYIFNHTDNGDVIQKENNPQYVQNITFENVYTKNQEVAKVKVYKTDMGTAWLDGATLVVTDASGTEVFRKENAKGAEEIELEEGTYTLTEEVPPNGFILAKPIQFTITFDGENPVITIGNDVVDEIVMKDEDATASISNIDSTSNQKLENAHLQILDGDKLIYEWDTKKEVHTVTHLTVGKTYTLRQTAVPKGYAKVKDTTFVLNLDGTISDESTTLHENEILLVKNEKEMIQTGKVKIKKIDGSGNVLKGSTLVIKDKDGKEVLKKENSNGTEEIELSSGTYTLSELSAPEGYAVAQPISFTVSFDRNGKIVVSVGNDVVNEVVIKNVKTVVRISKVDSTTGQALAGAQMQVLDANGNIVVKWLSTKDAHVIKGLKTGVPYTLKEKVAPDGYNITANTTFVLKADGTIDTSKTTTKVKDGILLVEDSKKSNVTTGADNGMKVYATILGISVVGIVIFLVLRKRSKKE